MHADCLDREKRDAGHWARRRRRLSGGFDGGEVVYSDCAATYTDIVHARATVLAVVAGRRAGMMDFHFWNGRTGRGRQGPGPGQRRSEVTA